ncbi:MAG: T9SS type A sorting domain-containing protein [Bacteroidales bacterium]|nr:T9SS type A sorting domain-containing protein [Bacteroidales bacterium]
MNRININQKVLFLFLFMIFLGQISFSQNLLSQLLEKKVILPTEKIVEQELKSDIEQQFTENGREDLELFAAANPTDTNNIIVSWMSLDFSQTATNPLLFEMMYTKDGGNTWNSSSSDFKPHNLSQTRAVGGGGDPVIVFDKNGRAHFSWLYLVANVVSLNEIYMDLVLYYAYSDDKGETWIRPDNDTIAWGVFDYVLGEGITAVDSGMPPDKQWMTINPQTDDIFFSSTEFYHADSITDIWGVRRKPADNLEVVTSHVLVPYSSQFASTQGAIVYDNKGVLHAIYPAYDDTTLIIAPEDEIAYEKLYYQNSIDDGLTWSDTVVVSKVFVNNMGAALQYNNTNTHAYERLYSSAYIATDTSGGMYDGRIYVVWNSNDTNFFSNVNVYLSYSDNNGADWSEPIMANSDAPASYKFHHRPSINVSPDGKVVIGWYDTRYGQIPDVYNTDFFVGVSYDGGETFLQRNISDNFFNYNEIVNSMGVGEYYRPAVTNSNVYVFWAQHVEDGTDLEIYYAKVFTDSLLTIDTTAVTNLIQYQPITDVLRVNLFPNPTTDKLNIEINSKETGKVGFEIYSIDGKLLFSEENKYFIGENYFEIDVSYLSSNSYILLSKTHKGIFYKNFIIK